MKWIFILKQMDDPKVVFIELVHVCQRSRKILDQCVKFKASIPWDRIEHFEAIYALVWREIEATDPEDPIFVDSLSETRRQIMLTHHLLNMIVKDDQLDHEALILILTDQDRHGLDVFDALCF